MGACRALWLALATMLAGCGSPSGPGDVPSEDTGTDAADGQPDPGDLGTDSGPDTVVHTDEPLLLFADDFSDLGPPYMDGYEESPSALPQALFAEDGSRWTQIQNSHPGANWAGYDHAVGAVRFFASGQPDGVASKMDLGRGLGFELHEGDLVLIAADFLIEGSEDALLSNTLIDLEDTDDLMLDGEQPGAGLRVRANARGALALDRGELVGSDSGEPPHFRLSNLTSDYVLPVGTWVRVEALLRLGTGVDRSTVGPIDASFDAAETAAWCEIWVEPRGGARELVLRQRGTNFLHREVGLEVFGDVAPEISVSWPEDLDYNSLQIGLTNNRSTIDRQALVDNVEVLLFDAAQP